MSDFDPGDVQFTVNGENVAQFTGSDFDVIQNVGHNEGPGGRQFGFNTQKNANGCNISFTVRQTSPSLARLQDLSRLQKTVQIQCQIIRNLDQYDPDEPIGYFTGQAKISMRGMGLGRGDAGDVSFTAIGIGYNFLYKAGGPYGTAVGRSSNSQPTSTS